jgi:hypothetical protein
MEGKLKRIEIDIKDSGSVVTCYRKPSKAQTKKSPYASEYDNRQEFAFEDAAGAVTKVEELLTEIK